MGKKMKNYSVSKQTNKKGRKTNSVKNAKKKKKMKSVSAVKGEERDMKQKISNICSEFKKISTTQAIVRQKLRRDEKNLTSEMTDICKDLAGLLDSDGDGEGEEEVAVVEDLACQVDDLVIGAEELARPGFVYTRWQQRKFLDRMKMVRRRGSSPGLCCESPTLCFMHQQNLQ